jgi:hypothetical protein
MKKDFKFHCVIFCLRQTLLEERVWEADLGQIFLGTYSGLTWCVDLETMDLLSAQFVNPGVVGSILTRYPRHARTETCDFIHPAEKETVLNECSPT